MKKENISFDEISIRGICSDLFHNLLFIILAAAAMWLGAARGGKSYLQPAVCVFRHSCSQ